MSGLEISIQIAARGPEDARALFEKCMEMIATGEHFDGRLVDPATDGGGCAQLYVWDAL